MTDDFTEAARAEAERVHFPVPAHRTPSAVARASAAAFRDGASWARTHLAAQEPTDAEVEDTAEALHYAQGFDDWGVANSYEREEARGLARAALSAARNAGRAEA